MGTSFINTALLVTADDMIDRTRWYGPNLVTIITSASETNGQFSLVRNLMRKDFSPPLHVHSREDESHFILNGKIKFELGEESVYAKAGDYIHLPRNIPHTFKILSETAETLLLITPGGFEQMFIECSRPALNMGLPPLNEKPSQEFYEKLYTVNKKLGASFPPF